MMLDSKVVKRDLKIIISWCLFKSLTHSVSPFFLREKKMNSKEKQVYAKKYKSLELPSRSQIFNAILFLRTLQYNIFSWSSVVMKYYCTVLFRVFRDSISN